jgi:hypothetical protein
MAKVRMLVSTASSEVAPGVPLREGEVHDVPDHVAAQWEMNRIARKVGENTKTTAERRADEEAELAAENAGLRVAEDAEHFGERPGDLATGGFGTPAPLNEPPTADQARASTQTVIGTPAEDTPRRGPGRPAAR